MTTEKSYAGWYFLLIVVGIYIVTAIFDLTKIISALDQFQIIILKIIPVFLLVFVLMALTNYFITPKMLVKYMGKKSGLKGWIISIIAGIISTGPIYLWYPLLNDLQKQGARNGLIATFLYNRAIKIPLLPILIFYFGLTYSIILMIVMIIISIFQGIIIEKLMEVKK